MCSPHSEMVILIARETNHLIIKTECYTIISKQNLLQGHVEKINIRDVSSLLN